MGLTFQVGAADQVLEEPLASKLAHLLGELYPGSGSEHSESELWYSTELGWSGWEALQTRVKAVLGPKAAAYDGRVLLSRLSPGEACMAIIGNSFQLDVTDRCRAADVFAVASRIAERVPVFSLVYPRDFARLPEVHEAILR